MRRILPCILAAALSSGAAAQAQIVCDRPLPPEDLSPPRDDPEFRAAFREVKAANKRRIASVLQARDGILLPQDHLLDVMVKRLHEYKRQSLKLLHVVTLYDRLINGRVAPETAVQLWTLLQLLGIALLWLSRRAPVLQPVLPVEDKA